MCVVQSALRLFYSIHECGVTLVRGRESHTTMIRSMDQAREKNADWRIAPGRPRDNRHPPRTSASARIGIRIFLSSMPVCAVIDLRRYILEFKRRATNGFPLVRLQRHCCGVALLLPLAPSISHSVSPPQFLSRLTPHNTTYNVVAGTRNARSVRIIMRMRACSLPSDCGQQVCIPTRCPHPELPSSKRFPLLSSAHFRLADGLTAPHAFCNIALSSPSPLSSVQHAQVVKTQYASRRRCSTKRPDERPDELDFPLASFMSGDAQPVGTSQAPLRHLSIAALSNAAVISSAAE